MLKKLLIKAVKGYKYFISPLIGRNCKYYPTCSSYFISAIEKNGYIGILQGIYRVFRCNPFSYGGYDPVRRIIIRR